MKRIHHATLVTSLLLLAPGARAQDVPEVLERGTTAERLHALREAAGVLEGPRRRELDELLHDWDDGQLDLDDLALRSLEVDPRVRAAVEAAAPPVVLDDVRFEDDRFRDVRPPLVDGQPFTVRPSVLDAEHVYLDLEPFLDGAGPDTTRWLVDSLRLEGQPVPGLVQHGGVTLRTGQSLLIRDTSEVDLSDGQRLVCRILRAVPGTETPQVEAWDLVASLLDDPMRWDAQDAHYRTRFALGLFRVPGQAVGAGSASLNALTSSRGTGTLAEPEQVDLEGDGTLAQRVDLRSARHDVEDPALVLVVERERFTLGARLDPRTTSLVVRPRETRLWGFGLGTTRLTVTRRAEDGHDHAPDETLALAVRHLRGSSHTDDLRIDAGASSSAETALRSKGLGPVELVVFSGSLESTALTLHYTFPWELLLACLVGGAIGTLLRRSAPADPDTPRPPAWQALLVGAAVALVLVLGLMTGLVQLQQVPQEQLATLAGVLVVAVLGGFVGRKLLERMARSTGIGE